MMRLLEYLTGKDFRARLKDCVLTPEGMVHSTFEMTLPASLTRAASGHTVAGVAIQGKRNRYPEAPAAGLYTTASDLCRLIILLNQRGAIDGHTVLDQILADTMVLQSTGVFTNNPTTVNNFKYWHNGINYGFRCIFYGYPNRQAGIAVMTNSDTGDQLYPEILNATAAAYGWN